MRKEREARIRRAQKQRMRNLHEARRQRSLLKKEVEETSGRASPAEAGSARGGGRSTPRGKRKREESEVVEESAPPVSGRSVPRRAAAAAFASRPSERPQRRRSSRYGGTGDLANTSALPAAEEDDWQQIPAEWLKSDAQEMDEDPDFGEGDDDDEQDNDGGIGDEDGDLDVEDDDLGDLDLELDEDDDLSANGDDSQVLSQTRRQSPRKPAAASGKLEVGDFGLDSEDLSADGASPQPSTSAFASTKRHAPGSPPPGTYPDAAWTVLQTYSEEEASLPDDFVRYECICANLDDWNAFRSRFPEESTDLKEVALLRLITENVIPSVKADYEAKRKEKERQIALAKAARKRQRIAEAKALEKAAAKAAKEEALQRDSRADSAQALGVPSDGGNARRASDRISYNERQLFDAVLSRGGSEALSDVKVSETDRRAARLKQREEEKKAREEEEMMKHLREAQGLEADVQQTEVLSAPLEQTQVPLEPAGTAQTGENYTDGGECQCCEHQTCRMLIRTLAIWPL